MRRRRTREGSRGAACGRRAGSRAGSGVRAGLGRCEPCGWGLRPGECVPCGVSCSLPCAAAARALPDQPDHGFSFGRGKGLASSSSRGRAGLRAPALAPVPRPAYLAEEPAAASLAPSCVVGSPTSASADPPPTCSGPCRPPASAEVVPPGSGAGWSPSRSPQAPPLPPAEPEDARLLYVNAGGRNRGALRRVRLPALGFQSRFLSAL